MYTFSLRRRPSSLQPGVVYGVTKWSGDAGSQSNAHVCSSHARSGRAAAAARALDGPSPPQRTTKWADSSCSDGPRAATYSGGSHATQLSPVSESASGMFVEKRITHGPSAELGRGPPQAAWRGAVVHPSGGPSAPGRRCWRLGRKRPSPFSNSGPTPLRSDPNLEGLKSLRCCCAKGVGHRAQLMLRARRGARENDYPVPLLRTPTPQKLSLSCPHSLQGGHNY